MLRVFVTGHRGRVGVVVERDLAAAGHKVVGYDRVDGDDVLNPVRLTRAMEGCDGVVHLAHGHTGPTPNPQGTMKVNLQGMWTVLCSAETVGAARVVSISSVNALGVFMGERAPDYLPIDDDHPCYAGRAYGISKRLSEDMCRLWSAATGIPVVSLRPPAVWTPKSTAQILNARRERPDSEWEPYWEYGAFIDVRDLSSAITAALLHPFEGCGAFLVAASDISTSGRSARELSQLVHPGVEWRGGAEYDDDPFRSLLVTGPAQQALGWQPEYTWRAAAGASDSRD